MKKNSVIGFTRPEPFADVLTDLLRTEARELIEQAVEAELAEFMKQFGGRLTQDGRAAVVRNGHHPQRRIQTGTGPVAAQIPKVRFQGWGPVTFRSALDRRMCARPRPSSLPDE